jgi:hypothetical protein
MTKKIILTLVITWSIIASGQVFAQMAADSTGFNQVIAGYNKAIGKQSYLYNGTEYEFYPPTIKGNAYIFDVNTFKPGRVSYDGAYYDNVPMMYDLNKEVVVILLYNNFTKISLINERISDFSLLGHSFVRINADSLTGTKKVATGFYDEMFNGKHVQLFAKRAKTIQTTTGTSTLESFFSETRDYYLKRGNDYISFGGKGALLSLLKDRKKELNQFIKANNIDYRSDPEASMTAIIKYYDQLNN